ncbi:MAG: hypothetical protein KA743_04260 [Geothrix sp.]|nr:hypothetical protein [Geothrix sp.]
MRPLALLLPCFLALPACAQKAKPAPAKVEPAKEAKVDWDGEWTLHASQSDKIDEQIETHLKDLNFGLRLLWKKKLQSACRSHGQLDILAGGTFSVALDKERSIDTPFDGTEETWKRSDGETFKASLSGQGPTLVQTLAGESYVLKHVYSMRKDGSSLALQVTYTHPKLDNPFSYKLVYKRKE